MGKSVIGSDLGKYSVEISMKERQRALSLARRFATGIPGDINAVMWALPILEAMSLRIEFLEAKLKQAGIYNP